MCHQNILVFSLLYPFKILSRSVIHSTLFSCPESGDSGKSGETGGIIDSGVSGVSGKSGYSADPN